MTVEAFATTRDVVDVVGPDAAGYLHGQLSQDVAGLATGETTWTFVLAPQGKIEAWGRLTRTAEDAFRMDVDTGAGPALAARLQRFLLRTKATVELREAVPVCSVRGVGVEPDAEAPWVPAGWGDQPGSDLIGVPAADAPLPPGVGLGDPDRLEVLRVLAGQPRWGREFTEDTIPASLGPAVISRSVSFTKGCYTGQELVARMDARGNLVPTRIVGIVFDDVGPEGGDQVMVDDDAVGVITSAAVDGGVTVALAGVARRVVAPASVVVDGVSGVLRELPAPPDA